MTPSSGAKDKMHPIGQNGTKELLSDGIVDTQKYSGNIVFKMHPLRQNGTKDFNSELIVYDGILVPNTYWGKTKSSSDRPNTEYIQSEKMELGRCGSRVNFVANKSGEYFGMVAWALWWQHKK